MFWQLSHSGLFAFKRNMASALAPFKETKTPRKKQLS